MAQELAELSPRVSGPVYIPGDPDYASEIAAFNTAIVHTPDVVVGATSAEDVQEAICYARANGYRVTVQSTGHGAHAPITSGLLLSMKRLDSVSVDPETRTATIGAGARWGAVIAAGAEHGLAPITGSSPNVGVVGYLLGGGIGPLSRSHGFSSDYITGLTVVTGEGDVEETSAEQNPDLFWALRGGKAGLGIVTEVRLRLVELKTLYAGALFFEEEHIEAALRAWIDWTQDADPQVTTSVAITRFPPLDFVPPPFRGRRLLSLRFAYPGPNEEGARLAAPLRAFAPVYVDTVGEMPASQIAHIHNDPSTPAPSWMCGMLLSHIDQDFASVLLKYAGAGTNAPFIVAEVRHMGNATRRDVTGGSAAGGRPAGYTFGVIGVNPAFFKTELPQALDKLTDELRPWISPETNINYMGEPSSPEQLASAWSPATYARLEEVRRKYDPQDVLAHGYSTAG